MTETGVLIPLFNGRLFHTAERRDSPRTSLPRYAAPFATAVQGRAALSELRKILSSNYFPRDPLQVKKELEEGLFMRPSTAFIRGAVDEILYGFFQEGDSYQHNRCVPGVLAAIIEITRDVSEPRFVEQIRRIVPRLSDDELPFVFPLVIRIPECARALSDVHYSKLKGVLRDGPLPVVVPMLERASKVQQLESAVRDRIKTLTIEELTTNIKAGRLKEAAAEQAVIFYCSCGSWNQANYLTEAMILPLLPYLKREHIEKIIRSPKEEKSDLPGSHGFYQFLAKVRTEKIIEPEELEALLRSYELEAYIPGEVEAADPGDELPF
jgi:hypothetical protein